MKNIILVSKSETTPFCIDRIIKKKLNNLKIKGYSRSQKAVREEQKAKTSQFYIIATMLQQKRVERLVMYRDTICQTQILLENIARKNGILVTKLRRVI